MVTVIRDEKGGAMGMLRQLQGMLDDLPPWARILIAAFLIGFTVLSIYGRVNTRFGGKIFSNVPESELQTNVGHIVQYTVIPAVVCVGYLVLLLGR